MINNSAQSDQRIELKIPLSYKQYQYFKLKFKMFFSDFEVCFPEREIHNVYFDTMDFKLLDASRYGNLTRAKVRLRSYSDSPDFFLEFKIKNGRLVRKEINTVNSGLENLPELQKKIILYSRHLPMFDVAEARNPVLQNSYRRQYYQHSSGIRMTLDFDLKFLPTIYLPKLGSSYVENSLFTILEWKFSPDLEEYFNNTFAKRLPFGLEKISKYVYGMSKLGW